MFRIDAKCCRVQLVIRPSTRSGRYAPRTERHKEKRTLDQVEMRDMWLLLILSQAM